MSVSVTLNGFSYTIPQTSETNWGSALTSYLQAIASTTLQKNGGTFTLTADADFGATYGLKSAYFKTRASNPSSAGVVRLANSDTMGWRNNANSANLLLSVDSSDRLNFNSVPFLPSTALTASRALVSDASGVVAVSTATSTEVGYLSGVTSAIQTQIDSKQATGNYITALTGDVTASGPGSVAGTIAANAVTNAKLATVATATFKGRTTAGTGNVEDLTVTQATALLNAMVGDSGSGGTKGLVPAPASGDSGKFLRGDATWGSALSNPMSTLGDMIYGAGSGVATRLAGNTTTTKKFFRQTGDGSNSAAPAWDTLVAGDIPNLAASIITSGTLATARGGTNQDFSASTGVVTVSSGTMSAVPVYFYSGYHTTASSWSRTSASYGDPTVSGTPNLTSRQSLNMTVTTASSNRPGVTFSAPATGYVFVSAVSKLTSDTLNAFSNIRLQEAGSPTIICDGQLRNQASNTAYSTVTLQGIYPVTSSSSYTFHLQVSASSGSVSIINGDNNQSVIEWTIKYIK